MKKIFIIACESSGDHHGAELVRRLQRERPDLEVRGLGGPLLAQHNVRLEEDMTRHSALGLSDVLRQYFKYRKIFYRALAVVKSWQPDVLILIDSPAFNLRFAKEVRRVFPALPILYYISPQLWAWGGRRIHTVRRTVTEMLAILPFEKDLYEKAGVACRFVGHPLLDKIPPQDEASRSAAKKQLGFRTEDSLIGLLPGSRTAEVRRILPLLRDTAARLAQMFPEKKFMVAKAPGVSEVLYQDLLRKAPFRWQFFEKDFYDHVRAMDFALVASGTATLETALLGTPFFLVYKASRSTYWAGRFLVKVRYLGLVNLLLNKPAVPEFIQQDADPETMAREAEKLLKSEERKKAMKEDFLKVRQLLGSPGASDRAARAVIAHLTSHPQDVRSPAPDKPAAHTR